MSKTNDGVPAFSMPPVGTTLRDWFAGQALNGITALNLNPNLPADNAREEWPSPEVLVKRRALWAYLQADAMLAAREGGAK